MYLIPWTIDICNYKEIKDLLLYTAYCPYGQAMPIKGNVTKILCPEFDGKSYCPINGKF